jgi:hypothetical protein
VFGDSHSRLYSSLKLKKYKFNVYYIQNISIQQFYERNTTIEELMDINHKTFANYLENAKPQYKHMPEPNTEIKPNDIIIFVMGEIDVRDNLERLLNKGEDLNEILEKWTIKYMECIKMNQSRHPDIKFGVQSVISATDNKNYVDVEAANKDSTLDVEIRTKATLELNRLLKEKCAENNLLFVEITEYYKNDESDYPVSGLDIKARINELDTRIKDDGPHVNIDYPEGIEKALEKLGIEPNIATIENFYNPSWYVFFYKILLVLLVLIIILSVTIYISNKKHLNFYA